MTKTTTTQNPASLKIKPPTAATPTTLNSSSQLNLSSSSTTEKGVHDSIMSEHIKEMAALQRTLLIQQHKAHMANIERQKDAVRDEIEQVANMLNFISHSIFLALNISHMSF